MPRPLIILPLLVSYIYGHTFPCGQSDDFNSCIRVTLESIVGQLSANGAPELGIRRLEPALLPDMDFDVKRRGALGLSPPFNKVGELAAHVRLINTTAHGLSKLKLLSVRSELKKSRVSADIQLMVPQVIMKGRFYINGRFGVVPIAGGGPYNITTGEVRGEWRLRGRQVEEADGIRLLLDECKLTPRVTFLHLEADNFLRSNPALSKMVVGFTNRFWPLLYEDSLPDLEQNLEKFGLDILNKIFLKIKFEVFPNATTTTAMTTTQRPTTQRPSRSTTRRNTSRPTTNRRPTTRTTRRPSTRRTQRTSTQRTTPRRTTPRTTTQRTTQQTTPRTAQTTTRKTIKFEFFFLG